jgi:hypothetical protein
MPISNIYGQQTPEPNEIEYFDFNSTTTFDFNNPPQEQEQENNANSAPIMNTGTCNPIAKSENYQILTIVSFADNTINESCLSLMDILKNQGYELKGLLMDRYVLMEKK